MNEPRQVGTATVLRDRTYRLDAECTCGHGTQMFVAANTTHPLYLDGDAYFWLMTGQIDTSWLKIGDGLFMAGGNGPAGVEVKVPSKRWGSEEFNELTSSHPMFIEGPDRRVAIELFAERAS